MQLKRARLLKEKTNKKKFQTVMEMETSTSSSVTPARTESLLGSLSAGRARVWPSGPHFTAPRAASCGL